LYIQILFFVNIYVDHISSDFPSCLNENVNMQNDC